MTGTHTDTGYGYARNDGWQTAWHHYWQARGNHGRRYPDRNWMSYPLRAYWASKLNQRAIDWNLPDSISQTAPRLELVARKTVEEVRQRVQMPLDLPPMGRSTLL